MPNIRIQTVVPGIPERVFEYVTGFAASGRVNRKALEERHGRLIGREEDTYTFLDNAKGGAITWHCTFDPPSRRIMRAQGSSWADRMDLFEPSADATLWTLVWEPKARGIRAYTQWLSFQLRGKSQVYQKVVLPVVRHFQEAPSTPRRPLRTRARRRRR